MFTVELMLEITTLAVPYLSVGNGEKSKQKQATSVWAWLVLTKPKAIACVNWKRGYSKRMREKERRCGQMISLNEKGVELQIAV